ncbi:unnamed protein product [Trichobilharzia szidati]|nr:unnamed protein product [Trichobilharzia szidati]
MYLLFFVALFIQFTFKAESSIFSQLRQYQLFDKPFLRTTRDSNGRETKQIAFYAWGRSWYLILRREASFRTSNFTVRFISTNRTRSLPTKTKYAELYTGYVSESNHSFVLAHLDEHRSVLSAHIHINSDIYVIEPLADYTVYIGNNSMLMYRLRDIHVIQSSSKPMHYTSSATFWPLKTDTFDDYNRRKRSISHEGQHKFCRLTLIADYAFYTNLGNKDGPKTISHIIKLFDRLNYLFLTSKFLDNQNGEMTGYGFLLQEIVIHESWTSNAGHYNSPTDIGGKMWTATSLLKAFSRFDVKQSCLAHLLSYKRVAEGILGMSWLASPDPKKLGGICSLPFRQNSKGILYLNTGWTTYVDYNGQQLVNALAELITAHELGHSWGADHDPDTKECNPPATSHGKYLMYTYSVSGYAENNGKFSPCSLRTIGACLVNRAPLCFDDSSSVAFSNLCGNSRIDEGEECDAGRNPHDRCCSSDCLLREGARCSPWNHACCTSDCQYASNNTICAQTNKANPCLGPGQCNGLSPICPGPKLLSTGHCDEYGWCYEGQCHPFCDSLGLETCICDAVEESCFICCLFPISHPGLNQSMTCLPVILSQDEYISHYAMHKRGDSDFYNKSYSLIRYSKRAVYSVHTFSPFLSSSVLHLYSKYLSNSTYHFTRNQTKILSTSQLTTTTANQVSYNHHHHRNPRLVHIHLQDYRPCHYGYCMSGKCVESRSKRILRFWTPVHYSRQKNFGTIVWDNLTLSTIILSLILWIPLSACVAYLNRYHH